MFTNPVTFLISWETGQTGSNNVNETVSSWLKKKKNGEQLIAPSTAGDEIIIIIIIMLTNRLYLPM